MEKWVRPLLPPKNYLQQIKGIMTTLGDILIYIGGILWGIELIPQIHKTIKTKNVTGISLFFYIICYIAYLSSSLGLIINKNWNVVFSYIPSFILLMWMIILILMYGKRETD